MAGARSITIVGSGVLGLHLASRLAARGARVRVVEAAKMIGGLARSHTIGSLTWDAFYHVILESDARTRALIGAAGMAGAIQWSTTRTGFYVDGRFHPMSNSLEFLRFPPLTLVSKARLAWTILYASRIRDIESLEHELVEPWLRRHSGDATFERLWRPLLRAKLGERYHHTSAAFIGATIARMYAARRAGLKQERFGWLPNGWGAVLTALHAGLVREGVEVVLDAAVDLVEQRGATVTVHLTNGQAIESDAVVLTTGCGHIEAACPQLQEAERLRLRAVEYLGVVCVSVLLDQPLGPYYVTNITDSTVALTAVIEMSALVTPAALGGQGLVYLPRYLSPGDAFWREDDATITERALEGLERLYPGARLRVRATRVARAREVMALPTRHYGRDAKPPAATSLPGIFIANSAQISAGTLNVNETLGVADEAERALVHAGML